MAAKVTWAPSGLSDVFEITSYIGADNAAAAMRLGSHLLETIDMLGAFPRMGRVLKNPSLPELREYVVGDYRVIYQLLDSYRAHPPRLARCPRSS